MLWSHVAQPIGKAEIIISFNGMNTHIAGVPALVKRGPGPCQV